MKLQNRAHRHTFGRIGLFGALVAVFFFLKPLPTLAAGCPVAPVDEQGGKHWCYDSGASGHVHLWTPSGFNIGTASTVVYVHGYNLRNNAQVRDNGAGDDGCVNQHYIDCAWDKHALARQFAASGLNALFIAIEAPTNNSQSQKWASLRSVLQSVGSAGGITPPNSVTAIGHSAGIFTLVKFTGDGRIGHMILLDTMYGSETKIKNWYNQGDNLKLTLVGGSSQNDEMKAVGTQLHCESVVGVPASFTDAQKQARCLYMDSKLRHMDTVKSGRVIPLTLSRTGGTPAGQETSPAPGTASQAPAPNRSYDAPRLEIPIPGLTLTNVTGAEALSLPWIGQYVSGMYTFMIAIVGLVASVMMIIGGFQYLTSGGDSGKIGKGKKRIVDAIIGMVLALGSYLLLYTINPELVRFRGLSLLSIQTSSFGEDGGGDDGINQVVEADPSPIGSGTKPQTLCTTKESCLAYCNGKEADATKVPAATPGMASRSQVTEIINNEGLNGFGHLTSPTAVSLLTKAGEIAATEGYKIGVSSGWRELKRQVDLVCEAYSSGNGGKVGHSIAWPGGSFHGVGFALDVSLWKNGEKLTIAGDSVAQNDKKYTVPAKKLAEIMIKAGFRRLNNEIWHFEPATAPDPGCRCYTLDTCSMPPNVKCQGT